MSEKFYNTFASASGNREREASKTVVELTPAVCRTVVDKFIPQMNITDLRQGGKIRFSGISLIVTTVLAYMCGYRSACAIGKYWSDFHQELNQIIPDFPDKPVSHDTIKRTIEYLLFPEFTVFIEQFCLNLLFESLSEQHANNQLPDNMVPFFKRVLLEYNQASRDNTRKISGRNWMGSLVQDDDYKFIEDRDRASGAADRRFKATIYSSSMKLNIISKEELEQSRATVSILNQLRSFSFKGCCNDVRFKINRDINKAGIENRSESIVSSNRPAASVNSRSAAQARNPAHSVLSTSLKSQDSETGSLRCQTPYINVNSGRFPN
ncbi:transposase family protein [Anaerobiospirillum sp. NML120449]|uniref:transposase family protein n=1 Tax=Anaerobiospirillum sp. NML120449 TaxID=2932817 RepID=UPI001FF4294F|nr:transposase family protein [Anaerobiospirillum sp. NML120449]MCK0526072.1 transposase family protein [Anaerobiospirillum sp. NML120449]